jgi:hypothetical protein
VAADRWEWTAAATTAGAVAGSEQRAAGMHCGDGDGDGDGDGGSERRQVSG